MTGTDAATNIPRTPAPRRLRRRSWTLALCLAAVALVCSVLLGGVSMWFLGAVALAGSTSAALTFNFHTPAAFVRLFALGRTAAKYGERLVGHAAAIADQTARRTMLFAAMAASGATRRAGWQLGRAERLSDFLDDVEALDYAHLRVTLPLATATVGALLLAIVTTCLLPLAAALFVGMAFTAIAAARLSCRAALHDLLRARTVERASARLLGAAMAAVVPLQAEARWQSLLEVQLAHRQEAVKCHETLRQRLAWLDMLMVITGPLAALGTLLVAWLSGARGEALLPGAFLAFAWLALGESFATASRLARAQIDRRAARTALAQWTTSPSLADPKPPDAPAQLSDLALNHVVRRAPDARAIGNPLDVILRAGQPTVLVGPSGCGKTSLLKQVAGWLDPDDAARFIAGSNPLDAAARRNLACFCPHDAAVLVDSVRENLFTPDATDEELWQALTAVELDDRIRAAGGLDAWITQDMLSLGEVQRFNLARAWLSRRALVLLDEPTEHLDRIQAERILATLLARLHDRIIVFSSHDAADRADLRVLSLA